jgi:hypothetical protein
MIAVSPIEKTILSIVAQQFQPPIFSAKALYLKNSGKEVPASSNEEVEINRPPPQRWRLLYPCIYDRMSRTLFIRKNTHF